VAGALISGFVADALGAGEAIAGVAVLTAASGLVASTRGHRRDDDGHEGLGTGVASR